MTSRKIYLVLSPDHMEVYYKISVARARVKEILKTDWGHIEHFIKDESATQTDWVNPKDDDVISIYKLEVQNE